MKSTEVAILVVVTNSVEVVLVAIVTTVAHLVTLIASGCSILVLEQTEVAETPEGTVLCSVTDFEILGDVSPDLYLGYLSPQLPLQNKAENK